MWSALSTAFRIVQGRPPVLMAGLLFVWTSIVTLRAAPQPAALDPSFNPSLGADGPVHAVVVQPDGKVLIAGAFTNFNGLRREFVARLNADGSLDPGFNPGLSMTGNPQLGTSVNAVAIHTDGAVLIGGGFHTINNLLRYSIARLHSDGSVDTNFPEFCKGPLPICGIMGSPSKVNSIHVDREGNFLAGGHLLRGMHSFKKGGTEDPTFRSSQPLLSATGGAPSSLLGAVLAMASDNEGRAVIVGHFTNVDGVWGHGIARLTTVGGVDVTFDPTSWITGAYLDARFDVIYYENVVSAVAVQRDGKILVAGAIQLKAEADRTTLANQKTQVLRLNANGSLDATFSRVELRVTRRIVQSAFSAFDRLPVTDPFLTIALEADGKILVAGPFTHANGVPRNGLVELNPDGTITSENFDIGLAGGDIKALAIQSDGKIVIGGTFTAPHRGIARLVRSRLAPRPPPAPSPDKIDSSFAPALDTRGEVSTILVQKDGKILVGGKLDWKLDLAQGFLVRLRPADGTLDSTFKTEVMGPDPNPAPGQSFLDFIQEQTRTYQGPPEVNALAEQSDGKVIIGGIFGRINGIVRTNLARLNSDGTLDPAFDAAAGTNGRVGSVVLLSDGKILIGGDFTLVNGVARGRVARLNPNGSVDTAFQPAAFRQVFVLMPQSDGKVLIGGYLIENFDSPTVLARLNRDGSTDTTFKMLSARGGNTARLASLALQSDGKILIGGRFETIQEPGRSGSRLARLNPDRSIDQTFAPRIAGGPRECTTGFMGRIIDCYDQTTVLSVATQLDGKILVGGDFKEVESQVRNGLARLLEDGSLDLDFNPNLSRRVNAIVLDREGHVLIGGKFSYDVNGNLRYNLARILVARARPALSNPVFQNRRFSVKVAPSVPGKTYVLEFKDSLTQETWHSLPPVTGDGSALTLTDPEALTPYRFYRARSSNGN